MLIIGLGNPGKTYAKTRHNAGFLAVDYLAQKLNLIWKLNKKLNSEIAIYRNLEKNDLILAKPLAFMNNSGEAVQKILSYYKIKSSPKDKKDLSQNLIIIHDDLDIPFGKYKISIDSRSAGQKGVESIIQRLKTKNFKRIRIGIKKDKVNGEAEKGQAKIKTEKFVLQNFSPVEQKIIDRVIKELVEKEILN